MTTLEATFSTIESQAAELSRTIKYKSAERAHRRADLEQREIAVHRWDGTRRVSRHFGHLVDISAGGIRIRTEEMNLRPDHQIRLRIELPEYAGISPFIDNTGHGLAPKREWVGWLAVTRVQKVDARHVDVAGRLVDMDDMDRGMLGLYLSTQPTSA